MKAIDQLANKKDVQLILNELTKPYSIQQEPIYEYAVSKGKSNLKILHLLFYDGLTRQEKERLYKERKKQIGRLFSLFKNYGFNVNLLNKILEKINNVDYPIQIAFEFNNKELSKIKIYFSNIKRLKGNLKTTKQLIAELLDTVKIPNNIKDKELLGEGIDSIGIDFLRNLKVGLKIYPYYHSRFSLDKIKKTVINQFKKYNVDQSKLQSFFNKLSKLNYTDWGFLYRISNEGKINGVKTWFRLENSFKKISDKDYVLSYISLEKGIEYYLRKKSSCPSLDYNKIKQEIYVLFLIVTTDCIFNCDYCFVKKSQKYMDERTAKRGVELLINSPGQRKLLKIYGGEPLLNFDLIKKIIPFARKLAKSKNKKLTITICTNMALINKKIIDFIKRFDISLALSSDGAPDSHDRYRKFKNGGKTSHIIGSKLRLLVNNIKKENLAVNLTVPRTLVKKMYDNFLHIINLGIDSINIEPIMSNDWIEQEKTAFKKQYKMIINHILKNIEKNKFYFITQINRELKYKEITEIASGGCILKRNLQLSPKGDLFADTFAVYSNNPCKILWNTRKGVLTKHLYCQQKNPDKCRICKEGYFKDLPENNNPTNLRNLLTIFYTKKLIKTCPSQDAYQNYIEHAKKHICF